MSKTKSLRQKLAEYDQKGIQFHEAKKALLGEGYSEDEIVIAAASEPFDKKPNVKRHIHNSFEGADEQAIQAAARELISRSGGDMHTEEVVRRAGLAAAANHPLGSVNPASVQLAVEDADTIGFPLFQFVFVGVFIGAVAYGMHTTTHLISSTLVIQILQSYICLGVLWVLVLSTARLFGAIRVEKYLAKERKQLNWKWYLGTSLQMVAEIALLIYLVILFF